MPDSAFLDILVKLASIGTSGICIFAIFWIGWVIWRPPSQPEPERPKTLRFFMVVVVVIAVISAATGWVNAKFNADAINKLETKNQEQSTEIKKITDDFEKYKTLMAEKISKGALAGPVKMRLNIHFDPDEVNPRNPQVSIKAFINTIEGPKPVPIVHKVSEGALSTHVDVPDMDTPFFIIFETPKGTWKTDDHSIREASAIAHKQKLE